MSASLKRKNQRFFGTYCQIIKSGQLSWLNHASSGEQQQHTLRHILIRAPSRTNMRPSLTMHLTLPMKEACILYILRKFSSLSICAFTSLAIRVICKCVLVAKK
jgi:hypothetical protein